MKEETIITIIVVPLMLILFFGGFFLIVRSADITQSMDKSKVCEFEYGENWTFEYHDYFGGTCVKLDYISLKATNRTNFNFTRKELDEKYCDRPGFWELKKWGNGCEKLNMHSSPEK